jgi:hypothetical protein
MLLSVSSIKYNPFEEVTAAMMMRRGAITRSNEEVMVIQTTWA